MLLGGSISNDDGSCLSLAELESFTSKIGSVAFDWIDLRPGGADDLGATDLVVVGDSGKFFPASFFIFAPDCYHECIRAHIHTHIMHAYV